MAKKTGDARARGRRLDDEIRKLEERQAARAVDRAIRWARLLDQLEALLDRADDLHTHGVPVDLDKLTAEERADAISSGGIGATRQVAAWKATCVLSSDLQLAENWLPMIGVEYRNGHAQAIADVRLRLEGKAPFDPSATSAEAIAVAITCVRMLLATDLRRAKGLSTVPSGEDLDVLERLRDARKTAKELAVEIAGKGNPHAVDEKRVERAIERLKKVHGFELPNLRGSGYSLSPSDRARLDGLVRGT